VNFTAINGLQDVPATKQLIADTRLLLRAMEFDVDVRPEPVKYPRRSAKHVCRGAFDVNLEDIRRGVMVNDAVECYSANRQRIGAGVEIADLNVPKLPLG
jgi:hypothetical protein